MPVFTKVSTFGEFTVYIDLQGVALTAYATPTIKDNQSDHQHPADDKPFS